MRLFIAEKPSMGMDIAKALNGTIQRGNGFVTVGDSVVTWAVGHLVGQAEPQVYDPKYVDWNIDFLPFYPERWQMVPNPKTKDQLKVVGSLIKKADLVVNAGDSAREGQLIIDELIDYFGYRGPAKRLWLQSMNTQAIRTAISQMVDNRQKRNLYDAALARSRADWYIGMNLTRAFTHAWRSKGRDETIHIGRVQTPLLCMLVARDLAIESFIPTDYYVLGAEFKHVNGSFTAGWIPPADAPYLNDEGHVTDQQMLVQIARDVTGKDALITNYVTKGEKRNPPLTFSLGSLQKACFRMFGLTPAQTLGIAQALYEKHKLTTYPRTDYEHLPEDEHRFAQKFADCAKSNFGAAWDFKGNFDFSLKSPAWDSSKIGDHHGLRPTETSNYDLKQLSKVELAVYRVIVRAYMAQFLPAYRYESTVVMLNCEGHTFKASGAVPVDIGWKVLFQAETDEEDEKAEPRLPAMAVTDECHVVSAKCDSKKTKPPARFNAATLLDAMEKAHKFVVDDRIKASISDCGMGTPATRSKMIENILKREYATEVKEGKSKVFISTALGRMLYHAAPKTMKTPDITAYFESLLKAVEDGQLPMADFLNHQASFVTDMVNEVKSGAVAAQMPDLNTLAPPERKAPARKSTAKGTASDRGLRTQGAGGQAKPTAGGSKYGKPTPKAGGDNPKKVCPKCESPMVLRSQGAFWGCTGYPNCRHTENADGAPKRAAGPAADSGQRPRPAPANKDDDDHQKLAF